MVAVHVLCAAGCASLARVEPPRASELPRSEEGRRFRIQCGTLASCESEARKLCGSSYKTISSTQDAEAGFTIDPDNVRHDDHEATTGAYRPPAPVPDGEMVVECWPDRSASGKAR